MKSCKFLNYINLFKRIYFPLPIYFDEPKVFSNNIVIPLIDNINYNFSSSYNESNQNSKSPDKSNSELKYEWSDKKILIVEDDDSNYLFLEYILKKTNVKILRAIDGIQAIRIARQYEDIDVILMDVQLPLMDGMDATHKIRSFRKKLPIIAQTAYANQTSKEKCFECGCNEYVTKPISREKLLQIINKYFKD